MVLSTLDRYLLGKLLKTFLPAFFGLCFAFFVVASFRLLKVEDLSLSQVALALPWVVPFLLPYLIPLAFLITLSLVYGRLVADREELAFGSLGIPRQALVWPALQVGALLALLSLWLTTSIVPHCHQMRKEAARAVFQQLFDLGEGEHLSRSFDKQGFSLYVRRYDEDGLYGIVLHHDLKLGSGGEAGTQPLQIVARRGRVEPQEGGGGLELRLDDVTATLQDRPGFDPSTRSAYRSPEPSAPLRFALDRFVLRVELGGRRRIKSSDYASADLRFLVHNSAERDLLAAAGGGAMATYQGQDRRGPAASVELATRAAVATAPLILALMTCPLIFWLQARSALVPFAASLAAASALFFAPLILGRSVAEEVDQPAWVFAGDALGVLGAWAFAVLASRR